VQPASAPLVGPVVVPLLKSSNLPSSPKQGSIPKVESSPVWCFNGTGVDRFGRGRVGWDRPLLN
jgi:hypothetical protein